MLLYIGNVQAQLLQKEWLNTVRGSQLEQYNSIARTPVGHIYAGGFFQEQFGNLNSIGNSDGVLTKYDAQGQILWMKALAGSGVDKINGVAVDGNNKVYITGEFAGTILFNNDSLVSQGLLDAFVACLDDNGQFLWAKRLGATEDDGANDICVLNNGNIVVTGYFSDTLSTPVDTIISYGLRDAFVITFNPLGQIQWVHKIGGPGLDFGNAIAADTNNNCYVTGSFRDGVYLNGVLTVGQGSYDAFAAKITPNGQLEWFKIIGGSNTDEGSDIQVDNEWNVVAVGWYDRSMTVDNLSLSGSKEEDGYVVKFDPNGHVIWGRSLAGAFDERAYCIDFDDNNDLYIAGTLDSILVINGDTLLNRHLNRPTDIFVIKYDKQGVYQWATTLGHYFNDYVFDLLVESTNSFYAAGNFQDTSIFINDTLISQNGFDVFVGKFRMDTTTVSMHSIPSNSISPVERVQIFPNPSSGKVNIYTNHNNLLNVKVYDIFGRIVYREINKSINHSLILKKGFYIFELSDNKNLIRENIIVK